MSDGTKQRASRFAKVILELLKAGQTLMPRFFGIHSLGVRTRGVPVRRDACNIFLEKAAEDTLLFR